MTRRICPKCQRGFLRASDVDAGDYECMACGFIAGFDQDGRPDYRTQLRLEEYKKRGKREMVKTADTTKAMPNYRPSTTDIQRVPDGSTAGSSPVRTNVVENMPENIPENIPGQAQVIGTGTDSLATPQNDNNNNNLPPVPEKPKAPWSIQKYYQDNFEAIAMDYAAMGGKKTRERWGISYNGWMSVKKMLNSPSSSPSPLIGEGTGKRKWGCPDAARVADAADTIHSRSETQCYPCWSSVKNESDEVKVAWLNNYGRAA